MGPAAVEHDRHVVVADHCAAGKCKKFLEVELANPPLRGLFDVANRDAEVADGPQFDRHALLLTMSLVVDRPKVELVDGGARRHRRRRKMALPMGGVDATLD